MSMERLNEIISRLRYVKSGDIIASADHNDLVDAVKEIRKILMCDPFGPSGIDYFDLGCKLEEQYTLDIFCHEPMFLDHYCLTVKPVVLPNLRGFASTSLLYDFHIAGMPDSIFNSNLRYAFKSLLQLGSAMLYRVIGVQFGCKTLNAPSETGSLIEYNHYNARDNAYFAVTILYTPYKKLVIHDSVSESKVEVNNPTDDWFSISIATHTGVRKGYVAIADKNNNIIDFCELSCGEQTEYDEFLLGVLYGNPAYGGRVIYDFMLLNYG